MKKLLATLLLTCACGAQVPPIPLTVNSTNPAQPQVTVYQGGARTIRVTYADAVVSNQSPFMYWATDNMAQGIVTASVSQVSGSVVDFTFGAQDLSYFGGISGMYGVGASNVTLMQGPFTIVPDPHGAGVDPVTFASNVYYTNYNWLGFPWITSTALAPYAPLSSLSNSTLSAYSAPTYAGLSLAAWSNITAAAGITGGNSISATQQFTTITITNPLSSGAYNVDLSGTPSGTYLGIYQHTAVPFLAGSGRICEQIFYTVDVNGQTNRVGGLGSRWGYGTFFYTTTNENYMQIFDDGGTHSASPLYLGAVTFVQTNAPHQNAKVKIGGQLYHNTDGTLHFLTSPTSEVRVVTVSTNETMESLFISKTNTAAQSVAGALTVSNSATFLGAINAGAQSITNIGRLIFSDGAMVRSNGNFYAPTTASLTNTTSATFLGTVTSTNLDARYLPYTLQRPISESAVTYAALRIQFPTTNCYCTWFWPGSGTAVTGATINTTWMLQGGASYSTQVSRVYCQVLGWLANTTQPVLYAVTNDLYHPAAAYDATNLVWTVPVGTNLLGAQLWVGRTSSTNTTVIAGTTWIIGNSVTPIAR